MHRQQDNPFAILMYHRVAAQTAGVAEPTWNVPPDRFRRQLEGLISRGYRPWSLRQALAHRRTGEPIPARTFVVTFDDGYESVYQNAWPILKELSVPATMFLVTAYLDTDRPFSFDDWTMAGSACVPAAAWKPLTTAQCVEMARQGLVELGSHTHTHADFRGRPEEFRRDLARSLEVLRNSFGVERPTFAFPFGQFDNDLIAVSRASGVLCALTAEQELVAPHSDSFTAGRIYVDGGDTAARLAWKLNGWYTTLRAIGRWLRRRRPTGPAPFGQRNGHWQLAEQCPAAATRAITQ
jgi:peptidoglycan/xylan/chitin deacetylase (PgdA/CDA1 family)